MPYATSHPLFGGAGCRTGGAVWPSACESGGWMSYQRGPEGPLEHDQSLRRCESSRARGNAPERVSAGRRCKVGRPTSSANRLSLTSARWPCTALSLRRSRNDLGRANCLARSIRMSDSAAVVR